MLQKNKLWEELRDVKLIVYDEVSMASKNILDTIDRSLRDLLDLLRPFEGIKVIFQGTSDNYYLSRNLLLQLRRLLSVANFLMFGIT